MTMVKACRVADLGEGESLFLDIGPKGIAVFNVGNRFFALRNQCPHAGAPVCKGSVTGTTVSRGPYEVEWVRDGEILRCPWHRWEFEIESGETLTEPRMRVKTYEVDIKDGWIYVGIPSRAIRSSNGAEDDQN